MPLHTASHVDTTNDFKCSGDHEFEFTVLCISNFTVFGKLAVVFLSVKIQKILIYGLKDLKNCHKFKHQNLQNSQGY